MDIEKVKSVADTLYIQAYEAEFGGKTRGRFLVSREHLKELLGVQRLHPSTTQALTDACLENGLVMIDMDDTFAFAETVFVNKWRKLPYRLVQEYTNQSVSRKITINDEDEEID